MLAREQQELHCLSEASLQFFTRALLLLCECSSAREFLCVTFFSAKESDNNKKNKLIHQNIYFGVLKENQAYISSLIFSAKLLK